MVKSKNGKLCVVEKKCLKNTATNNAIVSSNNSVPNNNLSKKKKKKTPSNNTTNKKTTSNRSTTSNSNNKASNTNKPSKNNNLTGNNSTSNSRNNDKSTTEHSPKRRTRAETVLLENLTSKSQWDRTFYPKKNTLMHKAAHLEASSGAQVAVIVWAPTEEQFYYTSSEVLKKVLKKSGLIQKNAIYENVQGLQMHPSDMSFFNSPNSHRLLNLGRCTPDNKSTQSASKQQQATNDDEDAEIEREARNVRFAAQRARRLAAATAAQKSHINFKTPGKSNRTTNNNCGITIVTDPPIQSQNRPPLFSSSSSSDESSTLSSSDNDEKSDDESSTSSSSESSMSDESSESDNDWSSDESDDDETREEKLESIKRRIAAVQQANEEDCITIESSSSDEDVPQIEVPSIPITTKKKKLVKKKPTKKVASTPNKNAAKSRKTQPVDKDNRKSLPPTKKKTNVVDDSASSGERKIKNDKTSKTPCNKDGKKSTKTPAASSGAKARIAAKKLTKKGVVGTKSKSSSTAQDKDSVPKTNKKSTATGVDKTSSAGPKKATKIGAKAKLDSTSDKEEASPKKRAKITSQSNTSKTNPSTSKMSVGTRKITSRKNHVSLIKNNVSSSDKTNGGNKTTETPETKPDQDDLDQTKTSVVASKASASTSKATVQQANEEDSILIESSSSSGEDIPQIEVPSTKKITTKKKKLVKKQPAKKVASTSKTSASTSKTTPSASKNKVSSTSSSDKTNDDSKLAEANETNPSRGHLNQTRTNSTNTSNTTTSSTSSSNRTNDNQESQEKKPTQSELLRAVQNVVCQNQMKETPQQQRGTVKVKQERPSSTEQQELEARERLQAVIKEEEAAAVPIPEPEVITLRCKSPQPPWISNRESTPEPSTSSHSVPPMKRAVPVFIPPPEPKKTQPPPEQPSMKRKAGGSLQSEAKKQRSDGDDQSSQIDEQVTAKLGSDATVNEIRGLLAKCLSEDFHRMSGGMKKLVKKLRERAYPSKEVKMYLKAFSTADSRFNHLRSVIDRLYRQDFFCKRLRTAAIAAKDPYMVEMFQNQITIIPKKFIEIPEWYIKEKSTNDGQSVETGNDETCPPVNIPKPSVPSTPTGPVIGVVSGKIIPMTKREKKEFASSCRSMFDAYFHKDAFRQESPLSSFLGKCFMKNEYLVPLKQLINTVTCFFPLRNLLKHYFKNQNEGADFLVEVLGQTGVYSAISKNRNKGVRHFFRLDSQMMVDRILELTKSWKTPKKLKKVHGKSPKVNKVTDEFKEVSPKPPRKVKMRDGTMDITLEHDY